MSKPTSSKWPAIYTQENRSGQPTFYVDLRAVGGGRPGFPTKQEAETRAEQARIQRTNEGALSFALPAHVRLDAAKAHEILSPHDVSILEAAKYYQKHVLAFKNAPTVQDIVERYIADRIKNNKRKRTIGDIKHRLLTFAADFGEVRLSDVTLDELNDWIADDEWEPRTRINFLTKISQLYNFAKKNKWVDANLAGDIDRPEVDETTPEIFSIEESENLLNHAHDFGLLPYIAIGLFAGVRTAEMLRMDGRAINFDTKTITIAPGVAKKRSQRTIEMQPALLAWLEACKVSLQSGGAFITQGKLASNKEKLLEAAGVSEWKANGLRHSFGTYHFAKFQNADSTSSEMGNSPDVMHRHYKALTTKAIAETFWNLRPQSQPAPQAPVA